MTRTSHTATIVLLLLTLISCNGNSEQTPSKKKEPAQSRIIRKHIPYNGEFDQITNMGSINIVFEPGPCNLEVEGTEQMLSMVRADVDCGILLLNLNTERNQDIQKYQTSRTNLTAYISAPSLRMLAICGSGTFRCNRSIKSDFIHIGSLRSGSIQMDSLICRGLKYEVNGTAHDSIAYIDCKESALFLSSGAGHLVVPCVNIGGELTIDDNSSSTIKINGKTDALVINNQGTGLSQFTGTYTKKTIYQGDKARIIVN